MNLPLIIHELRLELADVIRAIEALERLDEGDRNRAIRAMAQSRLGASNGYQDRYFGRPNEAPDGQSAQSGAD